MNDRKKLYLNMYNFNHIIILQLIKIIYSTITLL